MYNYVWTCMEFTICSVDTSVASGSLPTRMTRAHIGSHTSAIDTADPTLSCIKTVTCMTISSQENYLLYRKPRQQIHSIDYSNLILSTATCTKADQGRSE